MLSMVIETIRDMKTLYARFEKKGRMLPDGTSYVSSWIDTENSVCYQVMESDCIDTLKVWASNWEDIVDFEFVPVISSADMAKKMHASR